MELPINKIILASFAFALTHFKKILEISILPLILAAPFLLVLPQMMEIMQKFYEGAAVTEMVLPENVLIYLALFVYGYSILSINTYKLVVQGEESAGGIFALIGFTQFLRFIGLSVAIGLITMLPVMLSGIAFLQLVIYFLIIPIMLNFVNIALNQPSQYKWSLPFPVQINLFFLQVILPALVGLIFAALFEAAGLPMLLTWAVKVLVFYWTLISLALCYQLIHQKS